MFLEIPDEQPRENARRSGPGRVLLGFVLVVAVAIAVYAFGYRQGRGPLDAERAAFEERLGDAESSRDAALQQLDAALNVKRLQAGEIALLEAVVELDRRNFGIANEHLRKASAALARIETSAGGISVEQVRSAGRAIDAFDVNVATNLESQRSQVFSLAGRIRELIPDESSHVEPPPAAPATSPEEGSDPH